MKRAKCVSSLLCGKRDDSSLSWLVVLSSDSSTRPVALLANHAPLRDAPPSRRVPTKGNIASWYVQPRSVCAQVLLAQSSRPERPLECDALSTTNKYGQSSDIPTELSQFFNLQWWKRLKLLDLGSCTGNARASGWFFWESRCGRFVEPPNTGRPEAIRGLDACNL